MNIKEMTWEQVVETIRIAHQLQYLLEEPMELGDILRQLSERVDEMTRWIPVEERLPTEEDADSMGLVVVWHHDAGNNIGHVSVTHWHWIPINDDGITHWQRINPPEGV